MDALAVFMMFSFGVMGLTMVGAYFFHYAKDHWVMMAGLFGIALAWIADFNMWALWHAHVRSDAIGITLTGLAMAGTAFFLHTFTSFFSGLNRKLDDQAEVMELHELHKAA